MENKFDQIDPYSMIGNIWIPIVLGVKNDFSKYLDDGLHKIFQTTQSCTKLYHIDQIINMIDSFENYHNSKNLSEKLMEYLMIKKSELIS